MLGYAHINYQLNANSTAAFFAILVTLYFWWQNIKGVQESSDKALRIMQLTTVMVVVLIGWCAYTAWVRGAHLPPFPSAQNMKLGKNAMGWLYGNRFRADLHDVDCICGAGAFRAGDERGRNAGAGVSRN